MAGIDDLKRLIIPDNNDYLYIVDINGGINNRPKTKKITVGDLLASVSNSGNSGETLVLPTLIKSTAGNDDYALMIGSDGIPYKIKKSDLLAGLSSGGNDTGGSGGSTLWTPSQITTLLWFDASDLTTISKDSNNLISQWNDKSGNNRHLYQSSNSLKPTLNNQEIVFNNNYLRAATYDYGSNISMFFVAKYSDSNRYGLYDSAPAEANVIRNFAYSGGVLTNKFEWWDNTPSLSIDCAINELEILNFNYQLAANRTISKYVNDDNFMSISASSNSPAAWGTLTIGAINSGEVFFNGSVSEIIFTQPLTTTDRQKLVGYLANKWNTKAKLPTNHPYKINAPTV